MEKKAARCTDCGSQNVSFTKKVIDQVSGWGMPNGFTTVASLLMMGFSLIPVAHSMITNSPMLYLWVIPCVVAVFFGWKNWWLSFWGKPLVNHHYACKECGYAWSTREDGSQRVELPSMPEPVRRPRRVRARA